RQPLGNGNVHVRAGEDIAVAPRIAASSSTAVRDGARTGRRALDFAAWHPRGMRSALSSALALALAGGRACLHERACGRGWRGTAQVRSAFEGRTGTVTGRPS